MNFQWEISINNLSEKKKFKYSSEISYNVCVYKLFMNVFISQCIRLLNFFDSTL